jgi:hypothetical protein
MCAGDDVVFLDYWLDRALSYTADRDGPSLVSLNDGVTDFKDYAAHWLASRSFLDKFVGGYAYPPVYRTWWCDRELSDIAKREGCYFPAQDARIEHRHYSLGLSEQDATYRGAMGNYDPDEKLYRERKLKNFPITWKPAVRRD